MSRCCGSGYRSVSQRLLGAFGVSLSLSSFLLCAFSHSKEKKKKTRDYLIESRRYLHSGGEFSGGYEVGKRSSRVGSVPTFHALLPLGLDDDALLERSLFPFSRFGFFCLW